MNRSSLDKIRENLRLQQVYNTIGRYTMDILMEGRSVGKFRHYWQSKLYDLPKERVELSIPVKIRLMLQELGPIYVKMGQIISSRGDTLPDDWRLEFEKLQSNVPPFSYEEVEETIVRELGDKPENIFKKFNKEPLAAASTAQVHQASLPNGRRVAVKIQRPNIVNQAKADIGIMINLSRLAERRSSMIRNLNVAGMVKEFGGSVLQELDYRGEIYNAKRLKEILKPIAGVDVPEVYTAYSSSKVMTSAFIDGVKITDTAQFDKHGLDRKKLAETALRSIIKQMLIDGFFHADPHPGNVLINVKTGVITYIDCGMCGELTLQKRISLVGLLMVLKQGDVRGIAQSLYSLSKTTGKIDKDAYYKDFDRRISLLFDPAMHSNFSDTMNAVFGILQEYGLRLDADLTLAVKALMQAEAAASALHPEAGLVSLGYEMTLDLVKETITADRLVEEGKKQAMNSLREVMERIPSLTSATFKWMDQYEKGQLEVRLNTSDLNQTLDGLGRSASKAVIGIMLVGMIVGSAIVLGTFTGETTGGLVNVPTLAYFGYGLSMLVAGFFVLTLLWELWRRSHVSNEEE